MIQVACFTDNFIADQEFKNFKIDRIVHALPKSKTAGLKFDFAKNTFQGGGVSGGCLDLIQLIFNCNRVQAIHWFYAVANAVPGTLERGR